MTNHQRKLDAYRAANIEAARIIAADPVKYPGVMQEWATRILNSSTERTVPATRRAA